jgi:hypothetical protein
MRLFVGLIAAFPLAPAAQTQQSALRPEQQLAHYEGHDFRHRLVKELSSGKVVP